MREGIDGEKFSLLEALKEDRKGLVVLSPSLSFLDRLARASGTQDLYIALYPFGPQRERIRFSHETGIPLAAVTPIYFLDRPDHLLHKLLRAIDLCTKLDRVPARELAPAWTFFQAPEQWLERYLHCPEALEGMREVAERCRMESPPWGEWVFPDFAGLGEGQAFSLLEEKARKGAVRRYGASSRAIEERLAHELGIIRAKGFASYFLVVEDIVSRFPITCGRGSAAASLVSYCLGITHVDPLKHNLFFERFLNMGRNEPPDIDVDFPWDERDAVLSYVLDKYGPERCAMVANHVGFRMRGAVREVAKVYGIPEEEIQEVSDDLSHMRRFLRTPRGGKLSAKGNGSRAEPSSRAVALHPPMGSAAYRNPPTPVGPLRGRGHHPGCSSGAGPDRAGAQGGADHPVGEGHHRGGRAREDRPLGEPLPGRGEGRARLHPGKLRHSTSPTLS